ncbi:class F sortase [Streptomyces piniterrae]|uniref:Class F sortase n=1 Tax=Streptomyces piniterrae TaxID=2571125 RepID=A0A4U0NB58_9ACTN|nr:class F sortase [Streptomyces piniterrae]
MGNRSRDRGESSVIAGVTALALVTGLWLIVHGTETRTPPQPSAAQGFGAGPAVARPAVPQVPAIPPLPASDPVRVTVPSAEIDAPLMGLGLAADGSLDVPPDATRNLAGWYKDGTAPGARGTALVAGHVDSHAGPAVFYNLGSLRKNVPVEILRKDGRTAVFTVDAVEVYEGDNFPDDKVYGQADRPELRLITCGGGYDTDKQEYLGNVVVFAHLTGTRGAAAAKPATPATPTAPAGPTRQAGLFQRAVLPPVSRSAARTAVRSRSLARPAW